MKKSFFLLLLGVVAVTLLSGCVKQPDAGGAAPGDQSVDFDWKTTKQVPVSIVSDNGTSTPVFIYAGNTQVAAGYTPFTETVSVPVSASSLSVTTFPVDPASTKSYGGQWIWPQGQVVNVPLAGGGTVTVSGLIDLHADLFVKWNGWHNTWASFVAYWNAGATQTSSIILYADKEPFRAEDGSQDVVHSCLWPDCNHGEPVGGSSTASGVYLFEDMFPSMGDYDMNDMVVEEYVTTNVGVNNKVKSAELEYRVVAAGSGVGIAMAVVLPEAKASDIETVEMFRIGTDGTETPYLCSNASGLFVLENGVEVSSSDEAVIPLFDNIRNLIVQTVSGKYFNTVPGGGQGEPVRILVKIAFRSGSDIPAAGLTDLFIMPKAGEGVSNTEKWRGREIHLADAAPTARMDRSLFGTGDAATAQSSHYGTFRSKVGYVWAIYLPVVDFHYPVENLPEAPNKIYDSYPRFQNWILSGGTQDAEWYLHPNGAKVWN